MKNLMLRFSLLFFMVCSVAAAQTLPGLDSTFADNGVYMHDSSAITKIILRPDNKIIVLGGGADAMVFDADGHTDFDFANNGTFFTPFFYAQLKDIVIQNDGKILLGGGDGFGNNIFIERLNSNGSIDTSFGNQGYITALSAFPLSRMAIQPDGKIVTVGVDNDSFANDCVLVMRFQPDGIVDSSFGDNGRILHRLGMYGCPTNDVALLPDGRIIIGVTPYLDEIQAPAFAALRLLPDGRLDTSFNHTGIAWEKLSGINYCNAMLIQPDGKVLLGGYADSMSIIRFDTSGALDITFGNNGVTKAGYGIANAMALHPDGKILLGGTDDTNFVLYRYLPNGSIDNNFGNNGKIKTKIAQVKNEIYSIALQSDGKIIAAGYGEEQVWPDNAPVSVMLRYSIDALGIVDSLPSPQRDILIYPNPAGEAIHIQNTTDYKIILTDIYSITGRQITAGTGNTFSVKNIAPGAYIAAIHLSNHTVIYRQFIIHH